MSQRSNLSKVVGCIKNKLGENNELIRRKARFVAKGFLQVYGRDFFDTHSPVAKMKSIKLVLSLTASRDLELLQMDFDTAFLNAPVEEDIYMEQPEGFHEGQPNMVCKLNKAIYGLSKLLVIGTKQFIHS